MPVLCDVFLNKTKNNSQAPWGLLIEPDHSSVSKRDDVVNPERIWDIKSMETGEVNTNLFSLSCLCGYWEKKWYGIVHGR